MKIKADYANAPQWKETTIKSSLPKELKCLDEIAHNMWWAWNYEGRDLFKSLDADLYEKCNANPVLLLERLSYDRKEAIVKDKETMAKVKNVYKMFREYMDVKPNAKRPSVAYFCMEYGKAVCDGSFGEGKADEHFQGVFRPLQFRKAAAGFHHAHHKEQNEQRKPDSLHRKPFFRS